MLKTLIAALCLLFSTTAYADDDIDLSKPMELYATGKLDSTNLVRAVIWIAPVDGDEIGFMLNTPLEKGSLAKAVPAHKPNRDEANERLYFGGPILLKTVYAVVEMKQKPSEKSFSIGKDVWLVPDGKTVMKVMEDVSYKARFYTGFLSWRPEHLKSELRRGWFAAEPANTKDLFVNDTLKLYKDLPANYYKDENLKSVVDIF